MKTIHLLSLVCSTSVWAFTEIRTDSIGTAENIIQSKGKQYGAKEVLVVLDADSTLVTTYGEIGGTAWVSWQFGLLKTPELEPDQVSTSLQGMYTIINIVRSTNLMHTVERETAATVSRIQKAGFPTIILTGQPPMMRKAAEWQLRENGMTFVKSAIGSDIRGTWKVGKGAEEADFTAKEVQVFGLEEPRDVSYERGIFLAHDQHKGAMLRGLLHRLKLTDAFKAIVFLDDSPTNINAMKAAYEGRPSIDFVDVLYTREHSRFERFKSGDKWEGIAAFEQMKSKFPKSVLAH
jgi:hypothetical protein